MVRWNPLERITALDALDHPFFAPEKESKEMLDNVSFGGDTEMMFKDMPKSSDVKTF